MVLSFGGDAAMILLVLKRRAGHSGWRGAGIACHMFAKKMPYAFFNLPLIHRKNLKKVAEKLKTYFCTQVSLQLGVICSTVFTAAQLLFSSSSKPEKWARDRGEKKEE